MEYKRKFYLFIARAKGENLKKQIEKVLLILKEELDAEEKIEFCFQIVGEQAEEAVLLIEYLAGLEGIQVCTII